MTVELKPIHKQTLSKWLEGEPSELPLTKLKRFFRDQHETIENFDLLWNDFLSTCIDEELIAENIIDGKSIGYYITKKGVRAQEENFNLSREDVEKSCGVLIAKVQAWNVLAHQNDLPQVAFVLNFGSTVQKTKESFGDIDVVLAWRPTPCPNTPPPNIRAKGQLFSALSVLSSLPDQTSCWEVEDAVENWLEQTNGVRLTSVDALPDLINDEPFHASVLYQNTDLSTFGVLRQDEQNVLLSVTKYLMDNPLSTPKTKGLSA